MIEIKFIPVILNNNAETTPNKEMTVMTGSNTLNDLLTAGGIFSPRFICKALTFDNSMNNSVAIIATITPANIAPVPVLLNERTPEMFTASFAPSGTTLTRFQYWGITIANGTLSISGMIIAVMVGYFLAKNRDFENPLAASMLSLVSLIVMMPNTVSAVPDGAKDAVNISGVLSYLE